MNIRRAQESDMEGINRLLMQVLMDELSGVLDFIS